MKCGGSPSIPQCDLPAGFLHFWSRWFSNEPFKVGYCWMLQRSERPSTVWILYNTRPVNNGNYVSSQLVSRVCWFPVGLYTGERFESSRIRSWHPLHRHLESGQCPRRRWGWGVGGVWKKGGGGGKHNFLLKCHLRLVRFWRGVFLEKRFEFENEVFLGSRRWASSHVSIRHLWKGVAIAIYHYGVYMGWNTVSPISRVITGSTIRTLLNGKINPKDWQVLSLDDVGFLLFFRVVSGDYGKPCITPVTHWFSAIYRGTGQQEISNLEAQSL